jgi:ABC-type Zn uptake system ZnuABC Zn-binding protein ZnuA
MTHLTRIKSLGLATVVVLALVLSAGCGAARDTAQSYSHEDHLDALEPVALDTGEKLRVVATTNIVGDVVSQIGGDHIDLTTLMGVGIDPHSFVAAPSDVAAIHEAHVLFANGLGLEEFLDEMLENAGGDAVHVSLSETIEALMPAEDAHHDKANGHDDHKGEDVHHDEADDPHEHEGEDADHDESGDLHDHESEDPHTWFDVGNVIHWSEEIEEALARLDPANAGKYQARATAYRSELEELDAWIVAQVATIPESNRKLVTNHPAFGYLAERYGLEQVGAVYPISPSSEPSAQDIAALVDAIRAYGVPAVFTESTVNTKLAEQVASDTGVQIVKLYSGSVGEPGSGAETYVALMRYDVTAIVEALK